jgi:arylsulfatase A-like enzyme
MDRRKFLKNTAYGAAALGAARFGFCTPPQSKPNVIIILVDDQGYGDFSCHGNPVLKTPFMDKLASEAVNFDDFHVAPVCTPTRSQLMTGIDCLRNHACCVTSGRTMIRRDIPIMAQFFRNGGYGTGLFGKWHLGHTYPDRPMDKGFEKAVWFKGYGLQSDCEFDNDYVNPRYLDGLEEKRASVYCTDLWFQEAIAWMGQQQKKQRPFFVYLPLNAAHMPLWPDEKYASMYRGKVDERAAAFFGMLANVDDNVGRMDEWLKKSGLYEDTIVILFTDNGGTAGVQVFNSGLRGFKASNYEGGHLAACFMRWPKGGFPAGLKISTPTQEQDLLPTLINICSLPANGAVFDGKNLLPLIQKKKFDDRMFVVQYGQRKRPVKYDAAVIWNQWRLQNGKELYDIVKDREQKNDVSAQFPEIVKRMKDFYEKWWAQIEPTLDDPIPVIIDPKKENPVLLTSIDWWEVDADNIDFISAAAGGPRGGVWNIQVESEGKYRVELRRWPPHTNKAIGSEGPRVTVNGRPLTHKFTLIPAHGAVLETNGVEQQASTSPESLGVVFQINLPRGRSKLHGWFRDAEGKDLCGAFYALLTKLQA